jgi:hypothetical protein
MPIIRLIRASAHVRFGLSFEHTVDEAAQSILAVLKNERMSRSFIGVGLKCTKTAVGALQMIHSINLYV